MVADRLAKARPGRHVGHVLVVPELEHVGGDELATHADLAAKEAEPVGARREVALLANLVAPAVLDEPLAGVAVVVEVYALESHAVGQTGLADLDHLLAGHA